MVEIVKPIDELSYEKWQFVFDEGNLYLDFYALYVRKDEFHPFYEKKKLYKRFAPHIWHDDSIKASEVPLPEDVKEEAYKKFVGLGNTKIKVLKWGEK